MRCANRDSASAGFAAFEYVSPSGERFAQVLKRLALIQPQEETET